MGLGKTLLNKFSSEKRVTVVEIGNDWLKISENRCSQGRVCITRLKFLKLAQIEEPVESALSRIFTELKLGRRSVIMYIPRHLMTVKTLDLPSTDSKEIADMLSLQAGRQTPYSKEEIVSSHRTVGVEKEGYTRVMLAIARRSIVSERVQTLKKAGIEVERVAMSSEGVYQWFKKAYMPDIKTSDARPIAVLDIDANYSDFIVIDKGAFIFTRNIFIGSNNLIEEFALWFDKFIEEVKRSIERYQMEAGKEPITKIYLSGAARNLKEFDSVLSARLDIPAETTDPAKNIQLPDSGAILKNEEYRYVSATSLFGASGKAGELEIDLTPGEMRISKFMKKKRSRLMLLGVLSASIVMMASILFIMTVYKKTAYAVFLKSKILRIESKASEIEDMSLKIDMIEKRLDASGSTLGILDEIHRLIPRNIYLTNLNIEEKRNVILKGRANAMSDVFKFVTILENSKIFENVKVSYATTKKEGGVEYADFEIFCLLEKGQR